METALLVPLAALALDLALGDPPGWPHPVRLIGLALDKLESLSKNLSPVAKRRFGLACLAGCSFGAFAVVTALCALPGAGVVFALYFAFSGLSLGQLLREGRHAARLVDAGETEKARRAVACLVSRETGGLDAPGLRRTLAETLSENFCDGFVTPFFFLCLGGPGLLWLYKAVSTMDSMWGYKTPRFVDLGRAGALADDVLAYVPARLAACLLIAVGYVSRLDAYGAVKNTARDAARMASPNAGWPMAACAWLFAAAMGGRAIYFGKEVEKPPLGPANGCWTPESLRGLMRLLGASGLAFAGVWLALCASL